MTTPPDPELAVGRDILDMVQKAAQDVQGELAGLSDRLQRIASDQIGPQALPQLHAALRHAEAMERMMLDMLAQISSEMRSPGTAGTRAMPHGVLSGRRVLVADETETTLRFLASLLSSEGADVVMARSGDEAMDVLAQKPLDLFVTDAAMRGLSGAQLISALRARSGAAAATPVLVMTSDISVQRYDELIAAGASRVVVKPLPDTPEVLRIVTRLIQSRAGDAPAPVKVDQPVLFDPAPLTQLCRLAGRDTAREILDRLILDLVETLARLDRVGTGLQAGHGGTSDLGELRATTRVLIALAGTAGALMLLQKVQMLDQRLQDEIRAGMPPDLGPLLAEIRLLTRSAVAAIARLPLPDPGQTP